MTRQRSFKRIVRARMDKTGESYTAARAVLLAAAEPEPGAERAPLIVSDESIRARTGRGWEEWFDLLDEWGATELGHTEIARRVASELDGESLGWNSQAITVSYERARGLREVGERSDGFAISAQKTVAAQVDEVFDAFVDPALRAAWLPDGELSERTATKPRSARFDWGDGETRVHVTFLPKDDGRSTVVVEHRRLHDKRHAEEMKAFWRERLAALAGFVEV
jgi:uncharacterized protein YndB with AHSA1/START domain